MTLTELMASYERQRRSWARSGFVYDDTKTAGRSWVSGKDAQTILGNLLTQIDQEQTRVILAKAAEYRAAARLNPTALDKALMAAKATQ